MIFGKVIPAIPCACGCGVLIKAYYNKPSQKRKYHYRCSVAWGRNNMPRGENNPNFTRGSYIKNTGYRLLKAYGHPREDKNHYVFEHILVYEKALGCCVLKWGDIHHLNGKRLDNRFENLVGMTKAQHSRISRIEDLKKYGATNFLRSRSTVRNH